MYRILVADDEGIVLKSIQMIIEKHFDSLCEVQTAKSGRSAIELAESFRPDIILMDIQMPGINGIEAICEIQKRDKHVYFVVISAFDQFDYAQKAIDLGVVEFLTKPFNAQKIKGVIEKTMKLVDADRKMQETHLKNKEKLETVIPVIESGLIYNILFQEDYSVQIQQFKELLDIEEEYGYMIVIEFGDEIKEDYMTNPVGATVKAQKFHGELRNIVKYYFNCYMGAIMANKVVLFVPYGQKDMAYNVRIEIIQRAREMRGQLKERIDSAFKVGIGSVQSVDQLILSYKEAMKAMKMVQNSVSHIQDILPQQMEKKSEPEAIEKQLLTYLKKRNLSGYIDEVGNWYEFWLQFYEGEFALVKMKLFELLIIVQHEIKEFVQMEIPVENRELRHVLKCEGDKLRTEYMEYMKWLYGCRENKKEEVYSDLIMQAKAYIDEHFAQDINLEMVSRMVNISPYYFSKMFKEETDENFIDYLTRIRMDKAKEILKNRNVSIKEVCLCIGYKDPNYFSRLFKKQMGVTPTEYKEGVGCE